MSISHFPTSKATLHPRTPSLSAAASADSGRPSRGRARERRGPRRFHSKSPNLARKEEAERRPLPSAPRSRGLRWPQADRPRSAQGPAPAATPGPEPGLGEGAGREATATGELRETAGAGATGPVQPRPARVLPGTSSGRPCGATWKTSQRAQRPAELPEGGGREPTAAIAIRGCRPDLAGRPGQGAGPPGPGAEGTVRPRPEGRGRRRLRPVRDAPRREKASRTVQRLGESSPTRPGQVGAAGTENPPVGTGISGNKGQTSRTAAGQPCATPQSHRRCPRGLARNGPLRVSVLGTGEPTRDPGSPGH